MSKNCLVTIALLCGPLLCTGADAVENREADHPHWIWHSADQSLPQPITFTKAFQTDDSVVSAILQVVGESSGLVIAINDNPLSTLEPYDPLATIDLTERLAGNEHSFSVEAKGVEGPSAFFLKLMVEYGDGRTQSIVSDASWSTRMESDMGTAVSFGRVDPRYLIPKLRRVAVTAIDNYEQWKQALGTDAGTDPASFVVTPGFEIQLVRSATEQEGSWVSMEFDPQGRVIVAKESQGLLRMTLSEDASQVIQVESINDSLKECRGLVFAGRDLFANANNDKGLYRLKGTKDDRFGKPELIYPSSGGVGHGRNDLALGRRGEIYSIHGDAVDIPSEAIDHTSPFRDARRGKKTSEGHLLRIDPRGKTVEVLAAGLRNPFGIDFNVHGDAFTYDADAEYDMGSPWYRPTRVVHLVPGGDFGWRGVTRSWPSYYPDHADNARPSLDIGKGSPTAIKFASGKNFPDRFRSACFILDWAYGRVIAVHCLPRGSSYLLTAETFLQGKPLNVTDLAFAPDGSMYLVTGGRKTRSALYRVRFTGDASQYPGNPSALTDQQQARKSFAKQSRDRRRLLESHLHLIASKESGGDEGLANSPRPLASDLTDVWPELANPDPWIAQAANQLIEHYPVEFLRQRTMEDQNPQSGLRGLLSLARSGDTESLSRVIQRLNETSISSLAVSEKLIAIQAYSLCLTSSSIEKHAELAVQARSKLNQLYPDRDPRVNQGLSELLVRLKAPEVVAKTIALLEATDVQSEQMHYLYVLRGQREGWTQAHRETYFSALARSKRYIAGAGMPEFLAKIREEAIATLEPGQREALAGLIDEREQPVTSREPKPRAFVRKWTVKEILAAKSTPPRDLKRGEELFTAASCAACHRIAGRGNLIGPDLTAASRRFSRRDLLTSIVEPSLVIAENYRSVQIVTTDGNTYVGQAVLSGDYRSPKLRLATDPTHPFKTIEIEKAKIEIQRASPNSWMPTGLLDTLSIDEILDLLAYIEAAG